MTYDPGVDGLLLTPDHAREFGAKYLERANAPRPLNADDGRSFCAFCERVHRYCECDELAHLGIHSLHAKGTRAHPMGE